MRDASPNAIEAFRPERDRERLREIYLDSRRTAFHWMKADAFALDDFERDTAGEAILVADVSGRVTGFSSTWTAERFLHHLYLDPTARGHGHGSRLLAATIERFGTPMRLKCLTRNAPALRFYLARGFRAVGRGTGDDGDFLELEYRHAKPAG